MGVQYSICLSPAAAAAMPDPGLVAAADLLWSGRGWPVHIGLGAEAEPPAVLTLIVPRRRGGAQVHLDVAAWRAVVAVVGLAEARRVLAEAVDRMVRLPRRLRPGVTTGVILMDPPLVEARHQVAAGLVSAALAAKP